MFAANVVFKLAIEAGHTQSITRSFTDPQGRAFWIDFFGFVLNCSFRNEKQVKGC